MLTVAVVGILVVANFFVYENSKRWDLTENKQNTLAKETLETLEALPQPVVATAYFTPQRNSATAENLLDDYKYFSGDKFDFQFVDPLSNPAAAQEANITQDGTIVFQMGDRREMVTRPTEVEFTGALVRLMSDEQRVLYFLSEHGEYDPQAPGTRVTLPSKTRCRIKIIRWKS